MSEPTTEAPKAEEPTAENPEQQTQGDPADEPLGEPGKKALQAERENRKAAERERDELRAQLDKIARANESEAERLQRERDEAMAAAEAVPQKVADHLRDYLAEIHGIDEERRSLYLTSDDPETLLKQAMGLAERTPTAPKPDPTQGGQGAPLALNSNGLEQALKSKLGIA